MTLDAAVAAVGGTQAAFDYLQGIVEDSEAARDAKRALKAAMQYMKGAGVKYAMAGLSPELYAQCAFMIMGDWTENVGNTAEGARPPLSIAARQILLQLRYDKKNKEATDDEGP